MEQLKELEILELIDSVPNPPKFIPGVSTSNPNEPIEVPLILLKYLKEINKTEKIENGKMKIKDYIELISRLNIPIVGKPIVIYKIIKP